MYTVTLKKNEEKRVLNGFPWIYANEVQRIEGKDAQGSVATVNSYDGKFVCLGFINHFSKILVRVLTTRKETVDEAFFKQRIYAAAQRRREMGYQNSYRVVFGESDLLSGLIVDKYSDYLVCQFLCLGMDRIKQTIVDALIELFKPKGIVERSDSPVRLKEGLTEKVEVLYGEVGEFVQIEENGLKLYVDLLHGQKTGYYLDQKENRDNLKNYVSGKTVLDCFCNVGGFSLCAKKYGATKVTAVDVSIKALETVRKNAEANGFFVETVQADVFDLLREYKSQDRKFGVVILDPPAFTKTVDTVKSAIKGYTDINVQALKLVERGGFLISCSCSQHLSVDSFLSMLRQSVSQSGVLAQLTELRIQAKDHAALINTDESLYLKVAVLRVL